MTIDSFARAVLQRWRFLAGTIGVGIGTFEETCDACGQLLERPEVALWVARSYPVILVDEAQELAPERLRILKALSGHVSLFVAADEFQCLDERLNTGPFMEWFRTGRVHPLTVVQRTAQRGLLEAGIALRQGQTPREGDGLSISYCFLNVMPFRIGASLLGARGSRALIYAPGGQQWAEKLVTRLEGGMRSARFNIPPLRLIKEAPPRDEIERAVAALGPQRGISFGVALERLHTIQDRPAWLPLVESALVQEHRCCGRALWLVSELRTLIERKAAQHRAYGYEARRGIHVMSVHQAKNRQFQYVALLWPPGVRGDEMQQARLLYNGITRAVDRCDVFVQTQALLTQPPFRFD